MMMMMTMCRENSLSVKRCLVAVSNGVNTDDIDQQSFIQIQQLSLKFFVLFLCR